MEASSDFPQFTASLTIYSDSLSLADISGPLGAPSEGGEKGHALSGRRTPLRHTYWSRRSGPGPLDEQVLELVVFVEEHWAAIDQLRNSCSMRIFCGVFTAHERNCGFRLGEALLARLGAIDIALDVDVL